jgi:copper chaperone CopZ
MIRRQFMQLIALTGAGALSPLEGAATRATHATWIFEVRGFTCVTCAVGLDTLLGKEKGIVSSRSTYPEGKVTVVLDPGASSEAAVRAFIAQLGFTVAKSHQA